MSQDLRWRLTLSRKKLEEWLFVAPPREAARDHLVCWAPVINNLSQIQPGMTSKLTCSSFHTLSHRSAQWAENQYRATLKIAQATDCPFNPIPLILRLDSTSCFNTFLVLVVQSHRDNETLLHSLPYNKFERGQQAATYCTLVQISEGHFEMWDVSLLQFLSLSVTFWNELFRV